MHISDGILHPLVCAGGFAVSGVAAAVACRNFTERRIPELGVLTGLFFVASSIPLPAGVTSVHLLLYGLVGIVLGRLSFLSLLVALFFQAVLLSHGGLTTLGVNTAVAGSGALSTHLLFRRLARLRTLGPGARGFVCTLAGFLVSALVFAMVMASAGKAFLPVAGLVIVFHLPVIVVESLVTGWAVVFLLKVRPELLEPSWQSSS